MIVFDELLKVLLVLIGIEGQIIDYYEYEFIHSLLVGEFAVLHKHHYLFEKWVLANDILHHRRDLVFGFQVFGEKVVVYVSNCFEKSTRQSNIFFFLAFWVLIEKRVQVKVQLIQLF